MNCIFMPKYPNFFHSIPITCPSALDHIHHHSMDDTSKTSLTPVLIPLVSQICLLLDKNTHCKSDGIDKSCLSKTRMGFRYRAKKSFDKLL